MTREQWIGNSNTTRTNATGAARTRTITAAGTKFNTSFKNNTEILKIIVQVRNSLLQEQKNQLIAETKASKPTIEDRKDIRKEENRKSEAKLAYELGKFNSQPPVDWISWIKKTVQDVTIGILRG